MTAIELCCAAKTLGRDRKSYWCITLDITRYLSFPFINKKALHGGYCIIVRQCKCVCGEGGGGGGDGG